MDNQMNVMKAKQIIQNILGNTDVSPAQTRKDLEELAAEIEILIETLPQEE